MYIFNDIKINIYNHTATLILLNWKINRETKDPKI